MMPSLPEPLEDLVRPLFEVLPVNAAMTKLVVDAPREDRPRELVEQIAGDVLLRNRPDLLAGLWLFVDDLDASHRISQSLETPTGAFWHAIMHRREGDFANSKYWYRRAGSHPVFHRIDTAGGSGGAGTDVGRYDPFAFVDHVAAAVDRGQVSADLIDLQRREWVNLFYYAAEH